MKIAILDDSSSVRMMISICLDELGISEDATYKKGFQELGVRQFIKKPIQPKNFLHHIMPLVEKLRRKV